MLLAQRERFHFLSARTIAKKKDVSNVERIPQSPSSHIKVHGGSLDFFVSVICMWDFEANLISSSSLPSRHIACDPNSARKKEHPRQPNRMTGVPQSAHTMRAQEMEGKNRFRRNHLQINWLGGFWALREKEKKRHTKKMHSDDDDDDGGENEVEKVKSSWHGWEMQFEKDKLYSHLVFFFFLPQHVLSSLFASCMHQALGCDVGCMIECQREKNTTVWRFPFRLLIQCPKTICVLITLLMICVVLVVWVKKKLKE